MHSTFVLVKRDTGEIDGTVSTHLDSIDDFECDRNVYDVLDVPKDHPSLHEQLEWEAPTRMILGAQWGRELKKKRKPIVDI